MAQHSPYCCVVCDLSDSTGTLAPHRSPQGSSPEELVQACLSPTATGEVSGAKFHSALQQIYTQNGLVDRDFVNRYKWIKTKLHLLKINQIIELFLI